MDRSKAYNLRRFLRAQEGVYDQACDELRCGKKHGHWMWFIFPQIQGLGSSPTAQKFAILNEEMALEYLRHPMLGARLTECTKLVLMKRDIPPEVVFGFPDVLKLKSCMTLFENCTGSESLFSNVLVRHFAGNRCQFTMDKIGESSGRV